MNKDLIRILFVHSSSEMYGSDRCLYELLKKFDREQIVPVVVLPFEGILAEKIRALGIKVYIIDPWVLRKGIFRSIRFIPYLFNLPVSILRLIRIIKKENIIAVYSNTSVIVGSILSAWLMHKKHILHIRELYDNYPGLSVFYKYFLCLSSKRIIAISNSVASFVKNTCYQKVNVVYDGIAIDRFDNKTMRIPDMLLSWVQKGNIIISNIGRISQIKGQDLFIDAAHECIKHNNSLRFLIVGDVFKGNEQYLQYLQSMVRLYNMHEMIIFTGFREDIENIISYSNIIAVTTLITEGLGQVVMEGMTAGKVVIAPDRGGPSELIEHGIDGILYKAGNRDDLVKAILKIVDDPTLSRAIGERARAKAKKDFDIQKNVYTIEHIIKDVVKV